MMYSIIVKEFSINKSPFNTDSNGILVKAEEISIRTQSPSFTNSCVFLAHISMAFFINAVCDGCIFEKLSFYRINLWRIYRITSLTAMGRYSPFTSLGINYILDSNSSGIL